MGSGVGISVAEGSVIVEGLGNTVIEGEGVTVFKTTVFVKVANGARGMSSG